MVDVRLMTLPRALALALAALLAISSALAVTPNVGLTVLYGGLNKVTAVPSNTVLPVIAPTSPVVGGLEITSKGSWTQYPTSYTFQWEYFDTSTNISGATSQSYFPVSGDVGHTLAVKVAANNAKGNSTQAVSAPTSAVVAAVACAYGLNFSQGCNVAILAQGQLQ